VAIHRASQRALDVNRNPKAVTGHRTPKTGRTSAERCWPAAACAPIGSTTRWGEEPKTRPVHFREVFATLYERLGIDVSTVQFEDLAGRPQYLVGGERAMVELVG